MPYKNISATFLLMIACTISTSANCASSYEIQSAHNDEKFIINGELFEAKVYCLGWDEGDHVLFIDGSSHGICVSATLYNLNRDEKCEVWCE